MRKKEEKILNRNNRASNNTVVLVVIFVTTIVLVFLVAVLMFLMLDRKKTSESHKETVVSASSSTTSGEVTSGGTTQVTGDNLVTATPEVTENSSVTASPKVTETSAIPQPTDETVKYTMYVVNCNEWISLRKSPSTSATRLKEIPLGASCSFIEEAGNGFYKIIYNGTTGYALAQYLTTDKAAIATSSAPSTQSESSQGTLWVVNCDEWISLRSSASTSATRLAKIPLGASCEYLGSASNGFYRVRYNGTTGYALSQYLSTQSSYSSNSGVAASAAKRWVVNCDEWISLRSSASTSASRLAKIPLGQSCEYLGSAGNGFSKIRYNGTVGYALDEYLASSPCPY